MTKPHHFKAAPFGLNRFNVIMIGFVLWALALSSVPDVASVISDYFSFFFLGVMGAVFANSTGAGGGVVFIPMFNELGFSELQAVATSFAIQCFGMTAGAIAWTRFYKKETQHESEWAPFKTVVLLSSIAAIAGIWSAYGFGISAPSSLHHVFSIFSICLGIAILFSVYALKHDKSPVALAWFDILALFLISYFGGVITAWLSVGVGELVAIYLILRRFDVTMAVASAVLVSAFTVWSALPQHLLIEPNIYWQVLLFAGPGAVVGGFVARYLVAMLSARRLKVFFALWVLIVGMVTL